jgi:hypothetical protein
MDGQIFHCIWPERNVNAFPRLRSIILAGHLETFEIFKNYPV